MEHARGVLGLIDAGHNEYGDRQGNDAVGRPLITPLACSLRGGVDIEVTLTPGTRLAAAHDTGRVVERATCGYGLDPARQPVADEGGMQVAGREVGSGEVRAIERTDHPYFVATLYQPQLRSLPGRPHPVFVGLVEAAAR